MMIAKQADIDALLAAYPDRVIKYGEMHNHTDAGPTADGWYSLSVWKEEMQKLGMSFAAIMDHKQVAHMYHKDWVTQATEECDVVFIGGSEPGTGILDSKAEQTSLHYNMIVNDPKKLLEIVTSNEKFCIKAAKYEAFNWNGRFGCTNKAGTYNPADYTNDPDGILQTWTYPKFTTEEFGKLADTIYAAGGLMVHVHPKYSSYLISDDPLDYFFGNVMGIEIFTCDKPERTPDFEKNEDAYQMWVALLKAGKRAYATAGCDNHRKPYAGALASMYASRLPNSNEYMEHIHNGNFAPGWVGIRMKLGSAVMGGKTSFAGNRLVFSIGDMYDSELTRNNEDYANFDPSFNPSHTYLVELYDDKGVCFEQKINPSKMNYFALDADPTAKYYRIVVWDKTRNIRVGVSNPIWNA